MTTVNQQKEELCIHIDDPSPDERRTWLIKACAAAMRWYALNPDKRKDDSEHVVVISDLIEELNNLD